MFDFGQFISVKGSVAFSSSSFQATDWQRDIHGQLSRSSQDREHVVREGDSPCQPSWLFEYNRPMLQGRIRAAQQSLAGIDRMPDPRVGVEYATCLRQEKDRKSRSSWQFSSADCKTPYFEPKLCPARGRVSSNRGAHQMRDREATKLEKYVDHANHCLQLAKESNDHYSQALLREMAAEWLRLAEEV
jgi:hypothetical protein